MSHSWDSIQPRAEEFWPRGFENSVVAAQGFNFYSNTSSAFINELRFAAAKSVRTSIIVLASFNVLAAVGVICGVLWDSVVAARKDDSTFRFRPWSLWIIGTTEVYPFILSLGIVVQGIIFSILQAKGLQSLMILGCESVSQTAVSALFIVPILQFLFGMETSVRSLLKVPFSPRKVWVVPTLVGVAVVSLLAIFGLTFLAMPPNFCFAGLMWFVERWGAQCFGLLVGLSAALVVGGIATFLRLSHSSRIDPFEREAASRMLYYMFAALLANVLLLPYFYYVSFSQTMASDLYPAQLSMVATVVVNLSGIVTGGLYLFLRSSRFSPVGPRDYVNQDQERRTRLGIKIRRSSNSGYSANGFADQMQQPLSPSWLYRNTTNNYEGTGVEKSEEERIESLRQMPTQGTVNVTSSPTRPQAVWTPTSPQSGLGANLQANIPRPSFSATQQALLSPATAAALLPPPPGLLAGNNHRRDSSVGSHATVQIGLRLSNVDDVPARVPAQPDQPGKVHDLGCPKAQQLGSVSSRTTTPLRVASSAYSSTQTSDATSSPATSSIDDGIRLSPTVYSPEAQVRPLQPRRQSPIETTAIPAALSVGKPWPLSRGAPSDLTGAPKANGWI